MVEVCCAAGAVQVREVHAGGDNMPDCSAATLGLTLSEAKAVLAELQRHLVLLQTPITGQVRWDRVARIAQVTQ